jgi:predicted nucleotidyltransferase
VQKIVIIPERVRATKTVTNNGGYMKTIVNMIFGSHLYGTDTPKSDKDYKGVFMPSRDDILLGRIPKSINESTKAKSNNSEKNTSEDIDTERFSLHYFVQLAIEGQTVALDMLHAPDEMILESSDTWRWIVANRNKFYTKNLRAFIGYARRQAAKYGIRGSRLNAAREFISFLRGLDGASLLKDSWDKIPVGEHITIRPLADHGLRQVQACGKLFQETTRIGYIIPIMERFAESYGERAQKAANNEGIDWKAVSHAVRAALQVRELLTDNTITFPLKDADLVKAIKQGKVDYTTEAAPLLEDLMDEIERLAEASALPEKADRKFWENFIISETGRSVA